METRRRRIQLPPPDPAIRIAETTDLTTGDVRYRIRGTRAAGTIIITPELRGDQPIPTAVYVQFGEHAHRAEERDDAPVINGVRLNGGVVLTPDEYLTRERHYNLWLHRATGSYTSTRVPEATDRYGTAIVRALLADWNAQPDRDHLMRIAARRAAAGRLNLLYRDRISTAQAEIERLQRELLDHYRLAGELHKLAREHEASQPS